MKKSILIQKIKSYLLTIKQWYLATPERSLDEAYQAALLFQGNRVFVALRLLGQVAELQRS